MIRARTKPEVRVALSAYGQLSQRRRGPDDRRGATLHETTPRSRLWVIDTDAGPVARRAHNGDDGVPVYEDLGIVASAVETAARVDLTMEDGSSATLVKAPCVCGAGAVGMAGPVVGRHSVTTVRLDTAEWYEAR